MALSDAPTGISKLVGVPPPVLPTSLRGGTRLSGIYACEPFDGELEPVDVAVISLAHCGRGRMTASVEGRTRSTHPITDAITIIPKGLGGRWRFDGYALVSTVYLGDDRLRQCAEQVGEGHHYELAYRNDVKDERLARLLSLICSEVQQPTHHCALFLEHAVELACLQVLRTHSTLARPSSVPRHGLTSWQVTRVTEYMQANLDADLSLDELADLVDMTRSHFCSAFRIATGAPPHAYLTAIRMEAAMTVLRACQLTVLEVALAVGYQSQSAFSRVFRRTIGLTPSQYRATAKR